MTKSKQPTWLERWTTFFFPGKWSKVLHIREAIDFQDWFWNSLMSLDPPKGPKEIDACRLEERVLYSATPFTFFAAEDWMESATSSCEIPIGFDSDSWPVVLADLEQFACLHGFSTKPEGMQELANEGLFGISQANGSNPSAQHSTEIDKHDGLTISSSQLGRCAANTTDNSHRYAIRTFSDTLESSGSTLDETITFTNLIRDGHFTHASTPPLLPGYSVFTEGQLLGDWQVESGIVDLNGDHYLRSPSGGRTIDLNGDSGAGSIVQVIDTVPGQRYQVTFAATGNWVQPGNLHALEVSAGEACETFAIRRPDLQHPLDQSWERRTFTFEATSAESKLRFAVIDSEIRPPILGDIHMIALPTEIANALETDPSLKFDATELEYFRVNPTSWKLNPSDQATHWTLDTDITSQLRCRFSSAVDALVARNAAAAG